MVLREENMDNNNHVHCCITGCHDNSLFNNVSIDLNKKVSCECLFGGGGVF